MIRRKGTHREKTSKAMKSSCNNYNYLVVHLQNMETINQILIEENPKLMDDSGYLEIHILGENKPRKQAQ